MSLKPTRIWSASGTLAGAPQDFDLQVLVDVGYAPQYTEIHNLHASNTYSALIQGSTFRIPAGRALALPAYISAFSLDGTGAFIILTGDAPAPQAPLPALLSTSQVGNAVPLPQVDNVTLEATTNLHVKAAGLQRAHVLDGIALDIGQGGQYVLGSTAGLDFVIGETVTVNVTGGTSETYTAVAAAASPNEFTIGAGPGPGQSLQNLSAKVAALQPDVDTAQNGIEDFCSFFVNDFSGAALTVSTTSINVAAFGPNVADRLPGRVVSQMIKRVIAASDVTRNAIWLGLPAGCAILDATVAWRDATGAAKAWDGSLLAGGNTLQLIPGASPWVATDVLTVTLQYTLP